MSLASSVDRVDYVGNGSTSVYSYTFKIFNKNDLLVTTRNTSGVETTLAVDTDYTVTGVNETNGGTITLTAGNLTDQYALTIRRKISLVQETDLRNQGDFYPEAHEDQFDRDIMIAQQQQDEIDRSVKLPETINDSAFDPTLPGTMTADDSQGRSIIINDDANGFELGPTSNEIANAQAYAEQAEAARDATNSNDISYYQGISLKTRNKIRSLLEQGGIKFATLGDSTEAGVGNGSASVYGQCRTEAFGGYPNKFAYALIASDPAFVAAHSDVWPAVVLQSDKTDINNNFESLTIPYPSWQLIFSDSPEFTFRMENKRDIDLEQVVIYYLERTANGAATFDITIKNEAGSTLYSDTIDTYVGNDTIGTVSGGVAVGGRIASAVLPLSTTARNLYVTIDNVQVLDRGSGVPADGTAAIFGLTTGPGVQYKNFAVSSATLENNSAANQARFITTLERRQKAESFGANMWLIGFGTNDSKDGGLSLANFESEYKDLIDAIRTFDDEAVIIAATDPVGLADPYDNNPAYNDKIREIAREKKVDLLDVEEISRTAPSGFYADDVHPSKQGYNVIAAAMANQFGIAYPGYAAARLFGEVGDDDISGEYSHSGNQSDTSGNWVNLTDLSDTIVRPSWASGLELSAIVSAFDTSNFSHEYQVVLQGTQLHTVRASGVAVSSLADVTVALRKIYHFTSATTVNITIAVQGKNFKTRATSTSTKMYYRWIPYRISE